MKLELTPLEVTMLLHIYSIAAPIPSAAFPAQQSALVKFASKKLIEQAPTTACGWVLTPLGVAYVYSILSTPIPVATANFTDPRTGEIIASTD